MTDPRAAAAATDEQLRARMAELEREHRAAIARRTATELGSESYVAAQKAVADIEVEMNLVRGTLAERAGRGHLAVPGRD